MSTIIETFDIERDGFRFRVEVSYDDWMGAPEEEHDGHGCVVDLAFDPHDDDEVDARLEDYADVDAMELRSSYAQMVELRPYDPYRVDGRYYDVWATLPIAKREGWGPGAEWEAANPGATADERAMAAVQRDAEYLRGWYDDEWYWCSVDVMPYDPQSEDDELLSGYMESLSGIEHGLQGSDERVREVARELVEQCLHEMRKDGVINPVGLGEAV